MRWQDQSEKLTLPPLAAFLATLSAPEAAKVTRPENTLPRVLIAGECLHTIMQHVGASRAELGGLLLGQAYTDQDCADMSPQSDDDTPHLIAAMRSVESKAFDSTGVSLRMEADVWDLARPLLTGDTRVIGWYHSHPDLGAFFSDTDRTTQKHFFRQPYSIGIVIDPVRAEMKAYLGPACVEIPGGNIIIQNGG